MYNVYILYSKSTCTFYKGHTNNLDERLKRHNSGYEKYTSKGKPWILVWSTEKTTKSEAYILERKLKHLSNQRLVEFMLKYETEVESQNELELLRKLF